VQASDEGNLKLRVERIKNADGEPIAVALLARFV
jgi:hypothetical protein